MNPTAGQRGCDFRMSSSLFAESIISVCIPTGGLPRLVDRSPSPCGHAHSRHQCLQSAKIRSAIRVVDFNQGDWLTVSADDCHGQST